MLERHGHRVAVVENGVQAVAAFEQEPWDAVLLDVRMPEMDGMEAARAIRARETEARRARVPLIAFTASTMADERDACLAAGMDDVLAKPVTNDALVRMLARWCAR